MELTIHGLIHQSVRKYPDKCAVVDGDVRLTYREMDQRANRLANVLRDAGLREGDRCGIMLYNRFHWLEIYYALAKIGVAAVPINFRFAPSEVAYVIRNSEPKAILYEETFEDTLRRIREDAPGDRCRLRITPGHPGSEYERRLGESSAEEPPERGGENAPFFIAFTSGTTGFPKGTLVPHRNFILNLVTFAAEMGGLNRSDTMLVIMPLFHGNSTWFSMLTAMLGGRCVIHHSGGFDPEEVLAVMAAEKVTWTSLVPTMLIMMLNLPDDVRSRYDLSSVRMLLCSSSPLMTSTKEQTVAFFRGIDVYEAYGATETGWVTLLRPEDQLTKVRSVGSPVFGKEVRILDPHGKEVPAGAVGELFARGIGSPMKEYWRNPEATAAAFPFRNGWCTVGDMARSDEEGYIYLEDRKSDMIISGGENVYPAEVENVIAAHSKVEEAAVIGVPDDLWGERVHAVIKVRAGEALAPEEIVEYCRGRIAGYKRVRSVDFVDSFPKSPTGKILRRLIREKYWKSKGLYGA